MSALKTALLAEKQTLIAYLVAKVKANDFHAVQDAASDIREIDAKLEMLASMPDVPPVDNSAALQRMIDE